jgi:TrmH family RNA methyltransferase
MGSMITHAEPEPSRLVLTSRHIVSSRSNPTVKLIRTLRARRARERTGLAFVEGIRIVTEAVELGAGVEALVVAPDLLRSDSAWRLVDAQCRRLPCLELSADAFRSLASREGPEGIGALVRPQWTPLSALTPDDRPAGTGANRSTAASDSPQSTGRAPAAGTRGTLGYVALHEVQYPGNLGTIVRTAEAAGASGVILIGHTADPYDPAALRASAGALFALPLVRATIDQFLAWRRRHVLPLVGTSPGAATDYRAPRYPLPAALLMGSERHGLPSPLQVECDLVVRIPMVGRSDSLNLAIAAAIALYAMRAAMPDELPCLDPYGRKAPGNASRRATDRRNPVGRRSERDAVVRPHR